MPPHKLSQDTGVLAGQPTEEKGGAFVRYLFRPACLKGRNRVCETPYACCNNVSIGRNRMTTSLGELTIEEAATKAAGNWREFDCFVWHRRSELADPENWAIFYTHHRDSGLLDQSNASVIEKALEPFIDGDDHDVVFESHSHWAVGHIDGFSIRVFRNGKITDAFKAYHELKERLANYPVLDEEDYGNRETEATLSNFKDTAWRLKNEYDLPDGWEGDVYDWLSENCPRAIENRDDQGGCPSEDELEAAFESLGYGKVA